MDSSWAIGLNMAVLRGDAFGSEHVFTYGPLGFLWTRLGIGVSPILFLLYDLSIFMLSCALLFCIWSDRRSPWDVLLAFAVILASRASGSLPVGLFFVSVFLALNGGWQFLLATSVLAVLLFFIKLNYGLVVVCISLGLWGWAAWRKIVSWPLAGMVCAALAGLVLCSAKALNVSVVPYLLNGISVCSGYNDAMMRPIALDQQGLVLSLVFLAGMILLLLLQTIVSKDRVKIFLGASLAGLFYLLSFKNGFLRADSGHIAQFFELTPFIILGVAILASGWTRIVGRSFLAVVLALSVIYLPESAAYLAPAKRLEAVRTYVRDLLGEAAHKQQFAANDWKKRVFPASVAAAIGTNSYDILGKEISYAFANSAKYRPRPMPYSYLVYNRDLDEMNAQYFTSAHAPEYVELFSQTIDNRFIQWDEPRTKQALLERYEVVQAGYDENFYLTAYPDVAQAVALGILSNAYEHYWHLGRKEGRSPNICLLKKREAGRRLTCIQDKPQLFKLGEKVSIPATDELVYWHGTVHYTLLGKIRSLLFQPPVLEVSLWDARRNTITYRIVRDLLQNGVLVNRYLGQPGEIDGIAAWHNGAWKDLPRIEMFRIESPTPWAIKETIGGKFCVMTLSSPPADALAKKEPADESE
ncbi:MAG TPA: hypothetical protein DCZ95_18405 [Verrucomicrobia bacterium]|nr:hypothetical protein [Verrucomicrobiota bacterium]